MALRVQDFKASLILNFSQSFSWRPTRILCFSYGYLLSDRQTMPDQAPGSFRSQHQERSAVLTSCNMHKFYPVCDMSSLIFYTTYIKCHVQTAPKSPSSSFSASEALLNGHLGSCQCGYTYQFFLLEARIFPFCFWQNLNHSSA